MNYISSVSAIKYFEERKKWLILFQEKKFQCLNMQLIPDTARQGISFSLPSKQQHSVSLRHTALAYHSSFRDRKYALRPGHFTHEVWEEENKDFIHTSHVSLWTRNHTAHKRRGFVRSCCTGELTCLVSLCCAACDCSRHSVTVPAAGLVAQETLPSCDETSAKSQYISIWERTASKGTPI